MAGGGRGARGYVTAPMATREIALAGVVVAVLAVGCVLPVDGESAEWLQYMLLGGGVPLTVLGLARGRVPHAICVTLAGFGIVGAIGYVVVAERWLALPLALGQWLLTAAILQFSDWSGVIAVAVIYGAGQVIEGFFLTPRLVGERIGLNPLAVIFALLAFGQLFGFVGVLLALPASAVLMVAFRHLKRHYLRSSFYNA